MNAQKTQDKVQSKDISTAHQRTEHLTGAETKRNINSLNIRFVGAGGEVRLRPTNCGQR